MNINLLHDKLIRAARAHAPSERVPYAFEQRILARLPSSRRRDLVTLWIEALWRAAIPCAAAMLLLAVWAESRPGSSTTPDTADLGTQLETTLMASVAADSDLTW